MGREIIWKRWSERDANTLARWRRGRETEDEKQCRRKRDRERERVSEREQEDGERPTVEFPSRLARVSMTTGT